MSGRLLPILFGISLTTFGLSMAVLLYDMLKKDDDDTTKRGRLASSKRKEIRVDITIPKKYVPAVLGRSGAVIKNIEELTNTRIRLEKENSVREETLLHIWSDIMENIITAQGMIQSIIENQPAIETYQMWVPFTASLTIFGSKNFVKHVPNVGSCGYGVRVIAPSPAHKTSIGLLRKIVLTGSAEDMAHIIVDLGNIIEGEFRALAYYRAPDHLRRKITIKCVHGKYEFQNMFVYGLPCPICLTEIEKDMCIIPRVGERIIAQGAINKPVAECDLPNGKEALVKETTQMYNETQEACKTEIKPSYALGKINDSLFDEIAQKFIAEFRRVASQSSEGLMHVHVTEVVTPNLFWIVLYDTYMDIQMLSYTMSEYYENEENRKLRTVKEIKIGQYVAAKYNEDDSWCRAEVVGCLDSSRYYVFFLDYGYTDEVDKKNLLELCTDMLKLPFAAMECSLANVKPIGDTWDVRAVNKFSDLVFIHEFKNENEDKDEDDDDYDDGYYDERMILAKVVSFESRPDCPDPDSRRLSSWIPCLELYDMDKVNIRDKFIKSQLARPSEEVFSATYSASTLAKGKFPLIPLIPDTYHLD